VYLVVPISEAILPEAHVFGYAYIRDAGRPRGDGHILRQSDLRLVSRVFPQSCNCEIVSLPVSLDWAVQPGIPKNQHG
jgi:hypothetical protein